MISVDDLQWIALIMQGVAIILIGRSSGRKDMFGRRVDRRR